MATRRRTPGWVPCAGSVWCRWGRTISGRAGIFLICIGSMGWIRRRFWMRVPRRCWRVDLLGGPGRTFTVVASFTVAACSKQQVHGFDQQGGVRGVLAPGQDLRRAFEFGAGEIAADALDAGVPQFGACLKQPGGDLRRGVVGVDQDLEAECCRL